MIVSSHGQAGSTTSNRFRPDGSFDASFGSGGVVATSLRGSDAAFDLARQPTAGSWLRFRERVVLAVCHLRCRAVPDRLAGGPHLSLRSSVAESGLGHGLTRSLEVKLRGGAHACHRLRAVANHVRVLAGKKIPTSTPTSWLAEAESIEIALGC